jgi:DNA-binding MarR family transcriptional regulator
MHLTPDGMSLTTLARRTGTDRTTLTRNLAALQRAGWVTIARAQTGAADARSRIVRLTQAGAAKRATTFTLWRQAQDLIEATLGEPVVTGLHANVGVALQRLRPLIPVN